MIILEIGGGLGNQLFGYAFGRSLALKNKDKLYISNRRLINDRLRECGLDNFVLCDDFQYIDKKSKIYPIYMFRIYLAAILKRLKIKFKYDYMVGVHDTIWERKYIPIPYHKNTINVYRGIYQSTLYFDDIREELIKEFTIKEKLTDEEAKIERMISESESVCLHVRRGDFLSSSIHNVCTVYYFNNAIQLMKEKKKDCKFFVFSDDIEWTKENIIGDNMVYIENTRADIIDLHLMSKCKNFIIPNSTFSWWAQYLSVSEDKVVIAPNKWLLDEGIKENGIYIDSWLCIDPN